MSLILVFNKNSPRAHTESELGVLDVHGKLVKYVVHSFRRKSWKKIYFSSHKLPKQQLTNFWFQGILGVKLKETEDFNAKSKRSHWRLHHAKVCKTKFQKKRRKKERRKKEKNEKNKELPATLAHGTFTYAYDRL
jgi:hypothetical protein